MAMEDKAKNTLNQLAGKVKETVGEVTDDPQLEVEGRAQSLAGKVGEKVEDLKDAVMGAVEDAKDAVDEYRASKDAKDAKDHMDAPKL